MKLDDLLRTRPWARWRNPTPEVPAGMLGGLEALLCYYMAKDAFRGLGTIVDGGAFLGKSAYYLAQGLRENPCYVRERDHIHSFDLFQVTDEDSVEFIRTELKRTVAIGDSTRAIFESQVASVAEMIDVHAGDFTTISWTPQPIEILFVDIAKTESLCGRVAEVFFPMLIPGESVVIHQDYHHPWLPFIHVTMEYLAEYFEIIVPRVDNSAAFRFCAPIPPDVLKRAIDYDFSFEEQLGFMDRAVLRLEEEDRYFVQLARIVLQSEKIPAAVLLRELDKLEEQFKQRDRGYSKNPYFQSVRYHLGGDLPRITYSSDLALGKPAPGITAKSTTANTRGRPWSEVAIPAEVDCVPSMLSADEKQYLIWLAAEKYEGWGAIVELGVWLGSSSVALAEGLRRRDLHAKIYSHDLFRWEDYMADQAGPIWRTGENFLPLYLERTAAYALWIEATQSDLMTASWDGGPIEILFVDSAKTWDLTTAILKGFGRYLVPGRSRIVLQDFRYPYAHCLPLIFDSRPDMWKQVEDLESGMTVTFVPLKPLYGNCGISEDYSEESFPLASAEQLLRSRMAREEPQNRKFFLQGLYRKYLIDGPMDQALKLREEVLAAGIDEVELNIVENVDYVIGPRGWSAFQRGDYQTARADAERSLSIPGKISIYPLALLGFSLLHLEDIEGARCAMNQALAISPDFASGRLLGVEIALSEGQYEKAAAEALEVLAANPNDESTIRWCLILLFRAWSLEGSPVVHAATLKERADSFAGSPSFLTHLAIAEFDAGQRHEAMETLERALALAPDYKLAASYKAHWSAGAAL